MLKRQKEVALYQLSEEEKVIKQLERMYQKALEDVEMVIRILMTDEQTPSKINRIGYQQKLKAQLEGVLEALHNNEYKTINAFLQDSYTDSFVGTMYDLHGQKVPMILPLDQNAAVKAIQLDAKLSERKIHPNLNGEHVTLYESLGVDVNKLKKTIRQEITRGLATGMAVKDIARNISFATNAPLNRAKTIARTESHRIQETSKQDARHAAKANGADLVKYWDSIMDGDTRSAHRQLDGQTREVDEPFEVNGHRAMQPGGFGIPGMDIRCRCMALTRAKYRLSDEDLQRMQEKAKFWDLDKTESFEDFKKKYLKASEALKNQGKSGIMNAEEILIPRSVGARGANYEIELPDGETTHLTEGTRITNIKVIAGKGRDRQIDEIDILLARWGGSADEWQKKKGMGFVDYAGESYEAELHWYEEPTAGRHKWKVKPDADGNWFRED